jgi:excisionase family DNA binding protein
MGNEEYYTPATLAQKWGCHIETVYDLLRTDKLHGFKLGKDWRIPDSARAEYESSGWVPERKNRLPKMTRPVTRLT